MHDFLSKLPDPVEEAKSLFEQGKIKDAQNILCPILEEITAFGVTPNPILQKLVEDIILHDAQTSGIKTSP